MLKDLKITNLVLIEALEVSFGAGLSVLTGETGAGKSIILQAIQLLAGGRGGQDQVRNGAGEAVVEAFFELDPHGQTLISNLRSRGIEVDDTLVIKRVIPANGKSRFFINGSYSTAALAGDILEDILAVASQHEHQQLLAARAHLEFLDTIGGHEALRSAYGQAYDTWTGLRKTLVDLQGRQENKEQRREFLLFQSREIEAAALKPGEEEALVLERDRIKSSHDLHRLGREALFLLREGIGDNLGVARKNTEEMATCDPTLAEVAQRLASLSYEVEDLAGELGRYMGDIPTDPARLEILSARRDLLQQLKRKYGPSLEEVIGFGQRAKEELAQLEDMELRLAETQRVLAVQNDLVLEKGRELSEARRAIALEITEQLMDQFPDLCLEGARFEVRFAGPAEPALESLQSNGCDRAEFYFSANPGEPLKPVAKVASGGELSRLMLGLRCILAHRDRVSTVVFDEVDAGISGRTAEAVADKLQELSNHHQVICISHLPQIASRASCHFQVEKQVAANRTSTTITPLSANDRVRILANMLDGDSVSGTTLEYAKELLHRHQ